MSKRKRNDQATQSKPVCIFCNQTPLTREHFWPSWMKEALPQSKFNHHLRVESSRNNYALERPGDGNQKKVTGPPGSWQLKVVCSNCNNNWMSQIETAAKPIITALALGNPISLSKEDQEILSKWVFLKLIIGEFDSEDNRVITADQRKYFYKNQIIPPDWKIWIAKNPSAIWGNLFNQTLGVINYTIRSTLRPGTYRYKSAIFTIGELTIHIGKFSLREIDFTSNDQIEYMIVGNHADRVLRLHPNVHRVIEWESLERLSSSELHLLQNNMVTYSSVIRGLSSMP